MNVVAVDTNVPDHGTYYDHYRKHVESILQSIEPPLYILRWNDTIQLVKYSKPPPKNFYFHQGGATNLPLLLDFLSDLRGPIRLHLLTRDSFSERDVQRCLKIRKAHLTFLEPIHLHLFESRPTFQILDVFYDLPIALHLNGKWIGTVESHLDWDRVDFDYIMKDDSFRATLLLRPPFPDTASVKRYLREKTASLSETYSDLSRSLHTFYDARDVEGCTEFVQSFFKADVQRTLRAISKDVGAPETLLSSSRKQRTPPYRDPPLACRRLTYADFPAEQKCVDCLSLDWTLLPQEKKDSHHPLALLHRRRTAATLQTREVEPGMDLARHYVLGHTSPGLPFEKVVQHNNEVLSTLFQNTLPLHPVLWHMMLLYTVDSPPENTERLRREIRFLGDRAEFFVSLNPYAHPPVVAKLNACFWYVAHVAPRAFPNSHQNTLRSFPFNSQIFLDFYRAVYEPDYQDPEDLPLWRLWKTLVSKKSSIFPILAYYYESDTVPGWEENAFKYVVYRDRKSAEEAPAAAAAAALGYLSRLEVETVLQVYHRLLQTRDASPYQKVLLGKRIELPETELLADKLDHIKIHLVTCHPLVVCPITHKHWKKCIGPYDPLKESILQFFKRYCLEFKEYPLGWEDLWTYMNRYIFKQQNGIPELYPQFIQQVLMKVMAIFEPVMRTYSCREYLDRAGKIKSEYERLKIEKKYPYDVVPSKRKRAN